MVLHPRAAALLPRKIPGLGPCLYVALKPVPTLPSGANEPPDCHRKSQRRTKIVSPFLLSILRMHHRVVQSNLFDCTTQGGFRQIELDRSRPKFDRKPAKLDIPSSAPAKLSIHQAEYDWGSCCQKLHRLWWRQKEGENSSFLPSPSEKGRNRQC